VLDPAAHARKKAQQSFKEGSSFGTVVSGVAGLVVGVLTKPLALNLLEFHAGGGLIALGVVLEGAVGLTVGVAAGLVWGIVVGMGVGLYSYCRITAQSHLATEQIFNKLSCHPKFHKTDTVNRTEVLAPKGVLCSTLPRGGDYTPEDKHLCCCTRSNPIDCRLFRGAQLVKSRHIFHWGKPVCSKAASFKAYSSFGVTTYPEQCTTDLLTDPSMNDVTEKFMLGEGKITVGKSTYQCCCKTSTGECTLQNLTTSNLNCNKLGSAWESHLSRKMSCIVHTTEALSPESNRSQLEDQ